jgi:hypothetical protein
VIRKRREVLVKADTLNAIRVERLNIRAGVASRIIGHYVCEIPSAVFSFERLYRSEEAKKCGQKDKAEHSWVPDLGGGGFGNDEIYVFDAPLYMCV